MDVQELVARFKLKANVDTSIKSFVFDDLSSMNTNRNKGYKLILFKPPNSVITPFMENTNEPQWENYAIEFYIFGTWTKDKKDVDPLEVVYRQLEDVGDAYLRTVLLSGQSTSSASVAFGLIDNKAVAKTRGHNMHVDQLVGVKYEFVLRVFNSVCL